LTRARRGAGVDVRNRIVEDVEIPSEELLDHEGNPRQHPNAQKAAMRGILNEIGIVNRLLVYKSSRQGGRYVVLDGHLRKNEFRMRWPCTVLDLSDDEADLLIQAYDAVGALALTDKDTLRKLREKAEFQDASVRVMLDNTEGAPDRKIPEKATRNRELEGQTIPEMELAPYEHYDYVLVLCRTTFDWNLIVDRLGLQKVQGTNDPRYRGKIGIGRAVPADRLLTLLKKGEDAEADLRELKKRYEQETGKIFYGRSAQTQGPARPGPAAVPKAPDLADDRKALKEAQARVS
jgi:hypothetical protein